MIIYIYNTRLCIIQPGHFIGLGMEGVTYTCLCIIQPGHFTGLGMEGVTLYIRVCASFSLDILQAWAWKGLHYIYVSVHHSAWKFYRLGHGRGYIYVSASFSLDILQAWALKDLNVYAQACKISRLNDAQKRLQTVDFLVL